MAKYRVKKRAQLLYPDGSVRGEAGYIVDTSAAHDRDLVAEQGDALEPVRERSAVASPVNLTMFAVAPKATKKKATKKKATKKK
tara:strand:- start:146 stop:397 length:252 start_codon:yes stop_codon:yes gene_type:complete